LFYIITVLFSDQAVRTGLAMQRRLSELNRLWRENGQPQATCRIGINTGRMVIGNLGSRQVFNYTVTGDAANLGSRLEAANKDYQTSLMISEFTYAHLVPGAFHTRALDVINVGGRSQTVKVYEVYDPETPPRMLKPIIRPITRCLKPI
jgi:adenylate cyclase